MNVKGILLCVEFIASMVLFAIERNQLPAPSQAVPSSDYIRTTRWVTSLSWIFRSGTDLISLLILFLLLIFFFWLGHPLQSKPKALSFQIGLGWSLAGLFLIKYGSIDRCHFVQLSAVTWWANTKRLTSTNSAVYTTSWSVLHLYLFLFLYTWCE